MSTLSPKEIAHQKAHIHDDRSTELYGAQITCFLLAVIAVALRLISRRLIKAKLMADDYMILFALFLAAGFTGIGIEAIALGAGKHSILLKEPVKYFKLVFAISIIYLVDIAAVKFSILLLYRRIFGIDRVFNILSWTLAAVIFAYSLAGIFVVIFQTNPVHAFWDYMIPHTSINFSIPATTTAVLNVATDFLTLALPMPLIWQLQMPLARKLQLAGVFLLGSFVCIGSIYRAKIVHQISAKDATWSQADPALWASVEICIGIVSACLPTLRPVLNLLLHGTSRASEAERRLSDESEESLQKRKHKAPKRSYLDSLGFSRLGTGTGTGTGSMDEGSVVMKSRGEGKGEKDVCETVREDV